MAAAHGHGEGLLANRRGMARRNAPGLSCGLRAGFADVPPSAVELLAPWRAVVTDRLLSNIRHEVLAYTGPTGARRSELVAEGVESAVSDFLDLAQGDARRHLAVDRLFRRFGANAVVDSDRMVPLLSAIQLAAHDVSRMIGEIALKAGFPAAGIVPLGPVTLGYLRHLSSQAEAGLLAARRESLDARVRLARALLHGDTDDSLLSLAAEAGWPVPERFVVIVVEGDLQMDLSTLESRLIPVRDGHDWVIVACRTVVPEFTDRWVSAQARGQVAISWPVASSEVCHARRWAKRALALHRRGLLGEVGPVVDCEEHLSRLWQLADPTLSEAFVGRILAPLEAVASRDRAVFAETLLRWMTSRQSMDQIAVALGVHPQTVRYRIRRMKGLFGDRLVDGEHAHQIVVALVIWLDAG